MGRATAVSALLSMIVLAACVGPESNGASTTESRSVRIADSTDTTVAVTESWTATVPKDAVPANTTLQVVTRHQTTSDVAIGRGAADLTLASGQPLAPITMSLRLPEALSPSSTMLLLDDTAGSDNPDADPSTTSVRTAELNKDRTVATVQVDHLSDKEWWEVPIDNVAHFITSVAGQRTSAPSCATQPRPSWVENAIYLDEQNAPMLVCTGTDPNDRDIAVVKIKNNRGGALIVTAPVTPKWAALSLATTDGTISAAISDILTLTTEPLGVPSAERSRSWVLPPGGGIDIGLTRDSVEPLHGIVPITSKFTTASASYGLIWQLLSDAVGDSETLTALELGFMSACVHDAGRKTLDATNRQGLGEGVADLAKCVVELGPDIVRQIQKRLPAEVWKRIGGPKLNKAVNFAKTKLLPLVTVAQAAVAITDLANTLALGDGAFTITLFTTLTTTSKKPVANDHSFGPIQLGMTTDQATTAISGPITRRNPYPPCTTLSGRMNGIPVNVYVKNGVVTGIDTGTQSNGSHDSSTKVLTDRGVGTGSTPSQIRDAYFSDHNVQEGNIGGQGSPAVIVRANSQSDRTRFISFPIFDGKSGPPSIGRSYASEGC